MSKIDDVCVEKMSDEALTAAMGKLYRRRASAQICIGKVRGLIVAVSDDLPERDVKIIKRHDIVREIARRKPAKK